MGACKYMLIFIYLCIGFRNILSIFVNFSQYFSRVIGRGGTSSTILGSDGFG